MITYELVMPMNSSRYLFIATAGIEDCLYAINATDFLSQYYIVLQHFKGRSHIHLSRAMNSRIVVAKISSAVLLISYNHKNACLFDNIYHQKL